MYLIASMLEMFVPILVNVLLKLVLEMFVQVSRDLQRIDSRIPAPLDTKIQGCSSSLLYKMVWYLHITMCPVCTL